MSWYDVFSRFYDRSLEPLYRAQREASADALRLSDDSVVLDLPCGTGQSFDAIARRLGPRGRVVGADLSDGMLRRARERATRIGSERIHAVKADVHTIDETTVVGALGESRRVDRLHVFLGLSAFPRWEDAFARLWNLLAPGGRAVVVDVHADPLGFQGRMVNLVARADITRRFWEPMERVAADYERVALPSQREHGGQLYLVTGTKPNG